MKGEENTKEKLSFRLFPKPYLCTCFPREKKISYTQKLYIMAVDLYLWDGVFTGTAWGKEKRFEGGVRCLAGGYRTGLLFSEDVALQQLLRNTEWQGVTMR